MHAIYITIRVFVQQIFVEMTRMKNEMDKLETGIRRYTGDDLSSLTLDDIGDLEQQLEYAVSKVRARKVFPELLQLQLQWYTKQLVWY